MGMGIDFENPMDIDMGMSMGMIFKNGYECWYSYTYPPLNSPHTHPYQRT